MKYVNKDLLQAFEEGDCNIILHQCNCTKGMGAGIAKKIAEKYPLVDFMDKGFRLHGLGKILSINLYEYKSIVNLYSQKYPGFPKPPTDSFEKRIEWLKTCLKQVVEYFILDDICKIETKFGIPLIASGLAADKKLKGNMTDLEYFKKYIEPIIEEELKDLDVTVYYI